jgi:hypothetical protein
MGWGDWVHLVCQPIGGYCTSPGWWVWSSWWNKNWQGRPKYSEKTCPRTTLSCRNHPWLKLGWDPGCHNGKLSINPLSYGTAITVRLHTHFVKGLLLKIVIHFSFLWTVTTEPTGIKYHITLCSHYQLHHICPKLSWGWWKLQEFAVCYAGFIQVYHFLNSLPPGVVSDKSSNPFICEGCTNLHVIIYVHHSLNSCSPISSGPHQVWILTLLYSITIH